ncbi:hypothetical protein [Microbaculum marinum]|uniref:Uncharacterized protein n=1 Tax=Microbaculum marinum TaxID=1764581 RepID=A0AAW9RYI8_9HYPH
MTAIALGLSPLAAAAGDLTRDRLPIRSEITGDNSYVVKLEAELPTGWNAVMGMDVSVSGVEATSQARALADEVDPWSKPAAPGTVAWASVSMPAPGWIGGQARLRVQLNPYADSAAVSGSLTRSRSLGDHLRASLSSDLIVRETGLGTVAAAQSWEANRSLRIDLTETGTALIARGQVLGSGLEQPEVNTTLTAERPLGGGLGMSTSLGELETGEPVLTVGARFNRTW